MSHIDNHILFVHVPKTAGTSFRIAAERYFGKSNTFYDYAPDSDSTSKMINEVIYQERDFYKLYTILLKQKRSFLSGHFPVNKYAPLYDTFNVVSFVREPVSQVLSHYIHYKNLHGYKKSLRVFVQEERFRNMQSKLLSFKPLAHYGFIGLTEEYNTSIDLFNAQYGTQLEKMYLNKKKEGSLLEDDININTLALIKEMNIDDLTLYAAVSKQFEIRKMLHKKGLPYTYGTIQKMTKNQISGFAYQRGQKNPIDIDIYKNNIYLETVLAKNFRPGQILHNVERKGFIGFDYGYQKESEVIGKFRAVVCETKQEL